MAALLSNIDSEAMKTLLSYADELDKDEICSLHEFLTRTYIEYDFVKRDYGEEIASELFNHSKNFTLNPFEIRGAARYLGKGTALEKIAVLAIDGMCDSTAKEFQQTQRAIENSESKNNIIETSAIPTAQAINGDFHPEDWVIVKSTDEYNGLIGKVTAILATVS